MVLKLDFKTIKQSKKLKTAFREGLETRMAQAGEYLNSAVKTDYILDAFIHQGYWSAFLFNFYFDFIKNEFYELGREFGAVIRLDKPIETIDEPEKIKIIYGYLSEMLNSTSVTLSLDNNILRLYIDPVLDCALEVNVKTMAVYDDKENVWKKL